MTSTPDTSLVGRHGHHHEAARETAEPLCRTLLLTGSLASGSERSSTYARTSRSRAGPVRPDRGEHGSVPLCGIFPDRPVAGGDRRRLAADTMASRAICALVPLIGTTARIAGEERELTQAFLGYRDYSQGNRRLVPFAW
jgi:hypothetical protein